MCDHTVAHRLPVRGFSDQIRVTTSMNEWLIWKEWEEINKGDLPTSQHQLWTHLPFSPTRKKVKSPFSFFFFFSLSSWLRVNETAVLAPSCLASLLWDGNWPFGVCCCQTELFAPLPFIALYASYLARFNLPVISCERAVWPSLIVPVNLHSGGCLSAAVKHKPDRNAVSSVCRAFSNNWAE